MGSLIPLYTTEFLIISVVSLPVGCQFVKRMCVCKVIATLSVRISRKLGQTFPYSSDRLYLRLRVGLCSVYRYVGRVASDMQRSSFPFQLKEPDGQNHYRPLEDHCTEEFAPRQ